jgi:serine/threonine protein kinase
VGQPESDEVLLPPMEDPDATVLAGSVLPATPDASTAAPARPMTDVHVSDFALAWALRHGWIGPGNVEALRRQYGSIDAISDVPRILLEAGLIDRDQRRELNEVLALGRQVPSVRLRRRLGSGAVGGVYLARSVDEEQQVAIKVLHGEIAEQPEQRARFEREVSTLSKLKHECIPTLYGHDCDARVPYLIMEFVPGVTLAELLDEAGALPETYVLWAMVQVAQALEYAHRRGGGLVHRDIKPANIIVQLPEGMAAETLFTSRYPLKLVDFGLARPQDEATSLTMTGMVVGTPRYMAPEQVRGEDLDWSADLYSLGATMYHLLTGSAPYGGSSSADVMMAHLQQDIPDPSAVVPAITRRTAAIVMRTLAKTQDKRFSDYRAFVHACEQALSALDTRPVVLLRKPFRLDKETSTKQRSGNESVQARALGQGLDATVTADLAGGEPTGAPDGPSRTGAVRSRMTRHYDGNKGTDRIAVRNGSPGGLPSDSDETCATEQASGGRLQRHDDFFGDDPDDESSTGRATNALRRLLEARARGETTELDLEDLRDHTDRIRKSTERLMEAGNRKSRMPALLLMAAAVLLAVVAVMRFI